MRLGCVDLQPDFLFYPLGYGVHHPVGARAASDCDDTVIGIADHSVALVLRVPCQVH